MAIELVDTERVEYNAGDALSDAGSQDVKRGMQANS
jgi:hypothetical protein